jgi:DNA repair protein RadD
MKLRPYQEEAVKSVFDYFSQKSGNPIIVMPTGTGKALTLCEFIKRVFAIYPNQRIMMLTHVKELIEQNAKTLQRIWPTAPLGIYSAGLNQKDFNMPIIFGGVASVCKNPKIFGHIDLIIVDECHLISPSSESMYQKTINELKEINPHLKLIGLSATPYRLKQGMLTDDGIFTDICIDLSSPECFIRFITEGYLSPLIPFPTTTEIDVSSVGMVAGDFNRKELEKATDKEIINYNVCKEIIEKAYSRRCWLIFCNGIDHAEHISAILTSFGVDSRAVHSKKKVEENDKAIEDFKEGRLRCIVNSDKLTTGFDCPQVDFIGMIRHTMSPNLWVQMLGRGTRVSPGKENCLVLDFARNTDRLGPINDPVKPAKPGQKKSAGEVPIKICEKCSAYNWGAARFCCNCGFEFTFKSHLMNFASRSELIKGLETEPAFEWFDVSTVYYHLHSKQGSPPSIKVMYACGLNSFTEWVCLEHEGFPRTKARDWWRRRHASEPPVLTHDALQIVKELRQPERIRVHINKKPHAEIIDYDF